MMTDTNIAIILAALAGMTGCGVLGEDPASADESTPAKSNQAGDGEEAGASSPAQASGTNALAPVQIAAGYHASYVLLAGGQVRAWGQNQRGELGDGRSAIGKPPSVTLDATTPAVLAGIEDVVQIATGHTATGAAGNTTCVITKAEKVHCWGDGGLIPLSSSNDEPTPVEIPALQGARKLTMGLGHGCALMGDGAAKCWGSNSYGQLGNGTKEASRTPVTVSGSTGLVDITAAYYQVCATTSAGKALCWGSNEDRQITPADTEDRMTPTEVSGVEGAVSVGLYDDQSCAVHRDGKLSCWGSGAEAVQIVASDVKKVAGHAEHACFLEAEGTVHCWGRNDQGQLGQGEAGKPYSSERPLPVAGLSDVIDIGVGYGHTCAATRAHKVYCWGHNRFGELGDGTLMDRAAPVEVAGAASPTPPEPSPGFGTAAVGSVDQTWDALPKGCTHQARLNAEHLALLGKPFIVESATAEYRSGGGITVQLANYDHLDDEGHVIQPRGDQLNSNLYFIEVAVPDEDPEVPASPGRYPLSYEGNKRYMGAMSALYNSHLGYELRTGASADSRVELTHADEEWVCGSIDVTNRYGHIKGTFAAKVRA